jgi:general secretion pathway protein D
MKYSRYTQPSIRLAGWAVVLLAAAVALPLSAAAQAPVPPNEEPILIMPPVPPEALPLPPGLIGPDGQPLAPPTTQLAAGPSTQPATAPTTAPLEPTAPSGPSAIPLAGLGSTIATQPTTRPLLSECRLQLNFRDASLRVVLEYLSEAAGLIVLEEDKVDGRITVISRQGCDLDEAVGLIDTVLKQKGYAAVRTGRLLRIVTLEKAKRDLIPIRSGADPEKIQPSDRTITQIIPIRYADAAKLKTDLASLIPSSADVTANASSNTLIVTSTEATIRRLAEIIRAIDVHMSEVSQVKVYQLKYANAASAARLITEIFRDDQAASGANAQNALRGGRAFVFGGAGGGPGGFTRAGGANDSSSSTDENRRTPKVTASYDDRTNTLVVSASPEVLKVIDGVVRDLDANPAETQAVFVYRLRNGQAKNLESVLNGLFGATTSTVSRTTATGGTTGRTNTGFGTTSGNTGRTGGGTSGSAFGRGSTGSGGTFGSAGTTGRTGATGAAYTGRTGSTAAGRTGSNAAASDLAGQVYVVADEDTNSLLVTTASKNFDRVKAIISDLDRAVPQVLIKVLIAEVTHDNSVDLGVEFSGMNIRPSGLGWKAGTDFNVRAQQSGFIFHIDEANVTAAVQALATKATLDVLSRPYILTADNQQAVITVGQEVPFITRSQITESGQTINTIEYDDIGIILTVTPHINPQGLVTMDVAPEISTLTGETVDISETVKAPVFAKRSAQSRVAVLDGQTIVIGGLMEDRATTGISKVPILGDIPLVGLLFQRSHTKKSKTELLIFLTPHVAEQPAFLQEMAEDEVSGVKIAPDAVEKGALREHLRGMQRGAATQPADDRRSDPVIRAVPFGEETSGGSPTPDAGPHGAADGSAPGE